MNGEVQPNHEIGTKEVISIGSVVTLFVEGESLDGNDLANYIETIRIVDFESSGNEVSINSPFAQELIGKVAGTVIHREDPLFGYDPIKVLTIISVSNPE